MRARDAHRAVLERLAQHLEHVPAELRHLVEEEHAVVREADLARAAATAPPPTSATSEIVWCGARNGRSVTRPDAAGSRPATEWIDVTSSASSNVSGGRTPGDAPRHHRLAGPRRPDHQHVVPAGGGDLERAARERLPVHVGEVAAAARGRRSGGAGSTAPAR